MKKIVYCLIVAAVLTACLMTSCGATRGQPQLLNADGMTCQVRNNGPTGEVKVIFYQVPYGSYLASAPPLCKQWVIFTLPEGKEITLEFVPITDSSQIGSGYGFYCSSSLPQGARGGSEEARYEFITDGQRYAIAKVSGNMLKEFKSPDCLESGCFGGYCFGFRVE